MAKRFTKKNRRYWELLIYLKRRLRRRKAYLAAQEPEE